MYPGKGKRGPTIKPNQGFDDVYFGMTKDQVCETLGVPEIERNVDSGEISQDTEWVYPAMKVTLCFADEDDRKLGTVSFESESATLFGIRPVGTQLASFLAELPLKSEFSMTRGDVWPELDAQDYWCEELGLLVFAESEIISNVSIIRPDEC